MANLQRGDSVFRIRQLQGKNSSDILVPVHTHRGGFYKIDRIDWQALRGMMALVIGEKIYAGCEKGGSGRLNKTTEAREISLGYYRLTQIRKVS